MKGTILHDASKLKEILRLSTSGPEGERRERLRKELMSELENSPSTESSSNEANLSFGEALMAGWNEALVHEGEEE